MAGYIDGNTVRKLNTVPVRVPKPEQAPVRQPGKKKQKSPSRAYVGFFVVAVAVTLLTCVGYLSCQANNRAIATEIKTLEKQINTVTAINDGTEYEIYNNVDLNNVIQVATQELGMVKLTQSNIEYYESQQDEYINQYKDIPR